MAEAGVPMAEGDIPMEEGGVPMDEGCVTPRVHDPLHMALIFSRDLITYVMRRRVPFWDFGDRYGGQSPVTPFSFRIRRAVEYYLLKEDLNIYFLFARGFTGLPLDYRAFVLVANYMVDSVYPNVKTPNDLIRLMALFAQYTVLAYKRGIHLAPHYALIGIQDVIYRFVKHKGVPVSFFFSELGTDADNLIRETKMLPHQLVV